MDKSQNKKYIFLIDVDGTLVKDGTKVINSKIVEEIKFLKSKGHKFVIATGESLMT